VAQDFQEDFLDWVEEQATPDELLLFIMAGWNCPEKDYRLEVSYHALLAESHTVGALLSMLKSLATNVSPSQAWLGTGPRIQVHRDWLPLWKVALDEGFRKPAGGDLSDKMIFILTVDPDNLGAQAAAAWRRSGFQVELVLGKLPTKTLPREAVSPARLAWTLCFLPYVYERTMALPENIFIFLAEDTARPADGVTVSSVHEGLLRQEACGHWLGYRSLKKERTKLHGTCVMPGGRLLQISGEKKEAVPIGSKFFAVTRLYLRHLFGISLQLSPFTYQDHIHGELVAAGLLRVQVPSLTSSAAHMSHQSKHWIPEEDATSHTDQKLKVPQLSPVSPRLWAEASRFMTNRSWMFEPIMSTSVRRNTGSNWSVKVSYPCNDELALDGWELDSTGILTHYRWLEEDCSENI
jgi:hypothetical protein